jgi:hypothetical protein
MIHDGMNSNCELSAMKWWTVRPEVPDRPPGGAGLSELKVRTVRETSKKQHGSVWIWVNNGLSGLRGRTVREAREQNTCFWRFLTVGNGPSDLVGRTVRGLAENRRRARRRRLWPRFWVEFVSMGSWECLDVIPSDIFDMHWGLKALPPSMVISSWEDSRS